MAGVSFIVGLVGNVISILVFTSPIGIFTRVVKSKSTQNYEWLPYITTLLNTSQWTYYGFLKPGGLLVVTVNGAGSVLQSIYVILYLIYAPKDTRVKMARMVAILNVGFFGVEILITLLALHGSVRLFVMGCSCAALTVAMYMAPMAAMRLVVQTKSVEFMPFSLSFFLFLNGAVWGTYAVLVKDFFIGIPNGIGFILGLSQLIIYAIYRKKTPLSKELDLEKVDDKGRVVSETEMSTKSLNTTNSLPIPPISHQHSLTKIVKSLSLPPLLPDELSNWSKDDQLEN